VREEGAPPPIDVSRGGTLDRAGGALAPTLWQGSRYDDVAPVIVSFGVPSLPTLRDLARRALASPGQPPSDMTPATGVEWLALRAAAVQRLGDMVNGAALARLAPRDTVHPRLDAVRLAGAWFTGDNAGACALARSDAVRDDGDDAQRAIIGCQTLAGDLDRARLGLSLRRELKVEDDALLERIVEHVGGDRRALDGATGKLHGVHLAILAARKVSPNVALIEHADGDALATIVALEAFTLEARALAAERAAVLGIIDAAALLERYLAIPFTEKEQLDLAGVAQRERGLRGRAALVRMIAAAHGAERAPLIARAHAHAEPRGRASAILVATAFLASEIPVIDDVAGQAGVLGRQALLGHNAEAAQRWRDVARLGAENIEAARLLTPLLFLGGLRDENLVDRDALSLWRTANTRRDRQKAPARAALLAALLEPFGVRAPRAALVDSAPLAPATALAPLERAASEKRVGETILRAAAALSDPAMRESPVTMAAVLRSLIALGLTEDARRIALEAALAAGL
jgi:hypothetical protein